MEQLLWGEMGDYVRKLLEGGYERLSEGNRCSLDGRREGIRGELRRNVHGAVKRPDLLGG